MAIDPSKLCSVTECARIAGLTTGRIRQLLLSGELPGEKLGTTVWMIERAEAEKLAKTKPGVGRPRTGRKIS